MLAGGINMPIDRSGSVVQHLQSRASSRPMPRQPAAARIAIEHHSAIDSALRPAGFEFQFQRRLAG